MGLDDEVEKFKTDGYYVIFNVYVPDNRKRDVDNLCFKAAQDGIFQYLEQDDSLVKFSGNYNAGKDPDKKGFVEARIGSIHDERCNFLWG